MFFLKYRPQTIGELDNKRVRETLGKALLENKWAHAYLLIGPKGTGKTTTARLIAKILNCEKRQIGQEPCNKCDSCRAITAGSSLDVIEIDAASNTGVDDIRDLREKAKLTPSSSRYKVYIIDEVHMLSNSAFNALLKILEEPPVHVVFVLATTDPQKLPATVTSRCLVYDFTPSRQDVIDKLKLISKQEKITVEDRVLERIVEMVGLAHRDAQKLFEQLSMMSANIKMADLDAINRVSPDLADKLLQSLENKDSKAALKLIGDYAAGDGKIKELISELISNLRNKLLSGSVDMVNTTDLINKLIGAYSLMRDCPVPSLPLEMVVIEWCGKQDSIIASSIPDKPKRPDPSVSPVPWEEILVKTKEHNHGLVALLRASRPKELTDGFLTLEVFYKFHKDRLEEAKNREILEKAISDIMGRTIKVKFVQGQKERGEK
ncbi:MAG: DNA polymerase III subunit gamma/tau [Patescibacteria group bacterium]|nr:DNA polymerase III subunit gamma/tau [Patescibacteria group bacterium]MCL5432174.1 DNA polymerase III subunit gamma/tau [Patescibacteria group bacterium]